MPASSAKTNSSNKSVTREKPINALSGQIGDFQFSFGIDKTSRTSIIKHLIQQRKYQSYLEIGVRDGGNFDQIEIDVKVGVDPAPTTHANFKITSDEFFAAIDHTFLFDLIFIDGLHLFEQVRRDLRNALNHLSPKGTVVMHDCNPPTAFHQRAYFEVDGKFPTWNGTVWKAWVEARCKQPDLSMAVVNTDWGVGIIQRGTQELYPVNVQKIDYDNFDEDREVILNLISVEEFIERY